MIDAVGEFPGDLLKPIDAELYIEAIDRDADALDEKMDDASLLGGEELVTAHNPRNGALALRHEGEPELVYAGEVEADGSTELVHVNLASGETESARVPQDYRRPALALENDGVWVLLPSPSRLFHWRSGSEPVEVPLPVELERGGVAARDGWLIVHGTRERIPHVLVREPCLSDG